MRPSKLKNSSHRLVPAHYRNKPLRICTPRFVLVPFFGARIRAILQSDETWYIRGDVFKTLSLNESPYYNRQLFPGTQRSKLIWKDAEGTTTYFDAISEAGFYKLLCLAQKDDVGQTFNFEGGTLIYDMPSRGEVFDVDQREYFRSLLRSLHTNWLRHEAVDRNLDEWDEPKGQ